jgi:hypothetical protein
VTLTAVRGAAAVYHQGGGSADAVFVVQGSDARFLTVAMRVTHDADATATSTGEDTELILQEAGECAELCGRLAPTFDDYTTAMDKWRVRELRRLLTEDLQARVEARVVYYAAVDREESTRLARLLREDMSFTVAFADKPLPQPATACAAALTVATLTERRIVDGVVVPVLATNWLCMPLGVLALHGGRAGL